MIDYAQLRPGVGFQLDRALLYYAQRLVTFAAARHAIAFLIASGLRARHGSGKNAILDDRCALALSELRRDGVTMLAPLLDRDEIGRLVDYFRDRPVIAADGRLTAVETLPANMATAAYPLACILDCPNLIAVLNAPSVLRIVAEYLGCKPTLSSVGVRWSLPSPTRATDTQRFHRDVDDWRFLKLFIYLTDVDEKSGPHSYVVGSHRTSFALRSRPYALPEIRSRFGERSLITITGPRGTTFMADTQGIHRGSVPIERPRLILQAQYSLLPVYAFRYEPLERPDESADAYINRLLIRGRRPGPAQASRG